MKKVVILSGAGMSAESGISTFRDAGGLWEGHDIMEVASITGWQKNPKLVLDFYNKRRKQLQEKEPNSAHIALATLENDFDVHIITQNVDDLHERAGSTKVLHLHGELLKVQSTYNENLVLPWKKDLNIGDYCEHKSQLRPHIVWFGEAVPALDEAIEITKNASVFIVIGTSLQVYPAAGLLAYTNLKTPVYYIDPNPTQDYLPANVEMIKASATKGLPILISKLKDYL